MRHIASAGLVNQSTHDLATGAPIHGFDGNQAPARCFGVDFFALAHG
jgi:hypothetical protein